MGRRITTQIILSLSCTLVLAVFAGIVRARDNGQWTNTDATISNWIQGLKQPDHPRMSCCAFADGYWADDFTVENGKVIATITDDRDDIVLGRPHRENGSKWTIPDAKMKWDDGNPTGHGWLFLSATGEVYCYVTPGGV